MEWTDEKKYNACCATLSDFSCFMVTRDEVFFFLEIVFYLQRLLENSIG